MRVIVTRPGREAVAWVQDLRQRGFEVLPLALIDIAPLEQTESLCAAWAKLGQFRAVMFVSANAVSHFFQHQPNPWMQLAPATRAWAPGPGTRQALMQAGLAPALVDAPPQDALRFDSETLWRQVASQIRAGDQVLVVRGTDDEAAAQGNGRDWLASQLTGAGARVETVAAYRRAVPAWPPARLDQAAQAAGDGSIWLFSSSQAIANLQCLLPGQDWSRARAIATHPRIAQTARDAGFGVVCESRPAPEAVAASIESIR